jgi:hypothetical protein
VRRSRFCVCARVTCTFVRVDAEGGRVKERVYSAYACFKVKRLKESQGKPAQRLIVGNGNGKRVKEALLTVAPHKGILPYLAGRGSVVRVEGEANESQYEALQQAAP